MISVTLNSFVHRVTDKHLVITLAQDCGCHVKRIRRSRHWVLSGEEENVRQLQQRLNDEAYLWINKAIEKVLPKPSLSLSDIIEQQPAITVKQLVSETGCSLFEARQALDEFEQL